MLFINQLSPRWDWSTQVDSIFRQYLCLILTDVMYISGEEKPYRRSRNCNPNRDRSTVGADHPGRPMSVDQCPNSSVQCALAPPVVTGF